MNFHFRKIAIAALLLGTLAFSAAEPGADYPKNIIVIIGDGMGLSQVSLSVIDEAGRSVFSQFPHIGLMTTHSADELITDSGAGATAISTGKKTKNGRIGKDASGADAKTLLEYAHAQGMKTGLVASSSITHATPAAFAAHVMDRNDEYEIARQYLGMNIDMLIGGGEKFFVNRPDGQHLLDSFMARGYTLVEKGKKLDKASGASKILALLADEGLAPAPKRKDVMPTAAVVAMRSMSHTKSGYFLMVEGSQIDWAGHANNFTWMQYELQDFENTVRAILAEAGPNTLVLILADHETGGFAINGGSLKDGIIPGWTTKKHTATLLPVFAKGPMADQFSGMFDNTEVFSKLLPMIKARPIDLSQNDNMVPLRLPSRTRPAKR